jgi:hypothetical protein
LLQFSFDFQPQLVLASFVVDNLVFFFAHFIILTIKGPLNVLNMLGPPLYAIIQLIFMHHVSFLNAFAAGVSTQTLFLHVPLVIIFQLLLVFS